MVNSEDYERIMKEAWCLWPPWKIEAYNNFAVSPRATLIPLEKLLGKNFIERSRLYYEDLARREAELYYTTSGFIDDMIVDKFDFS